MNKDKIIHILGKTTEWSLYILIFCLPFSKSVVEISITIAFFSWVIKKILIKDFKLRSTPLNTLLFTFFIVTLVSFINAEFKLLFMRSLITKCLKYIVLYFIVVETIDSRRKFNNLLLVSFISAVIVTIDAYIQYYILHYDLFRLYPSFKYAPLTDPNPKYFGFPTGPFPFPNDLSAWMLIILIPTLAIFLWGLKKIQTKIILGAFLCPFLFLFYLTNTRSAWLGFLVSFLFMLFIKSKKAFVVFMVLLLLAVSIAPLFLPKTKATDIFGFSSIKDRFYMWRIGWKIFTEHPIIGNGLNMFFSKFKEYREDEFKGLKGSYAHNGFLQMATEIGIIGLGVFLLLIGSAFYSVLSGKGRNNAFSLGLVGGLLAFLIHSFFDTNLQSLPLVILFWFSLAILMSAQHINELKA